MYGALRIRVFVINIINSSRHRTQFTGVNVAIITAIVDDRRCGVISCAAASVQVAFHAIHPAIGRRNSRHEIGELSQKQVPYQVRTVLRPIERLQPLQLQLGDDRPIHAVHALVDALGRQTLEQRIATRQLRGVSAPNEAETLLGRRRRGGQRRRVASARRRRCRGYRRRVGEILE